MRAFPGGQSSADKTDPQYQVSDERISPGKPHGKKIPEKNLHKGRQNHQAQQNGQKDMFESSDNFIHPIPSIHYCPAFRYCSR